MFVPLALLSTPQQVAVLVNCCALIRTRRGSSPAADAARDDVLLESDPSTPHFADLERHVPAGTQHAGEFAQRVRHRLAPLVEPFAGMESWTAPASIPQNQQRSQLSPA